MMKVKQMVIMEYNGEDILVYYRIATHTTLDGDRYAYFLLKKLHPQFRKEWPMLSQAGVIILYDNVRPHHKDCFICIRRIWLENIATPFILS